MNTPPVEPSLSNRRLLLMDATVEPEIDTLPPVALSALLTEGGFDCTTVEDCAGMIVAVENSGAQGNPFAVALINIAAGTEDDAIRAAGRFWETDRDLQVILMSAPLASTLKGPWARKLRFNDRLMFLRKPLNEMEVRQAVRVMAEKRLLLHAAPKQAEVKESEGAARNIEIEEANSRMLQELSERRTVEEELKAAKDRAESASRAKSAFLANMSHEIRTPMNGLLGLTDLLLETSLTDLQRDYLETARKSGNSLLALLNEILDLSKIEAGRMEIMQTPFSLRELLAEIMRLSGPRAFSSGLELVWRIRSGVPEELVGDALRLRQILLNLINNALKFTAKGEVSVDIGPTDGRVEDGMVRVQFTVRDTGIGIAADKLQSIFDAFTQADSSTTRRFGGTGLGLAICQRLLDSMGGKIWVESQVGVGTTFHFVVPFRLGESTASVTSPVVLAGRRVLVVDDNETSRNMLEQVLIEWGMQVTQAPNAAVALEVFAEALRQKEPFEALLIDAQMPEKDGFALAEELTRHGISPDHTLMLLGAADTHGDVNRARQMGAGGYLLKPIDSEELLRELEKIFALTSQDAKPGVPAREAGVASGPAKPRTIPPDLNILVVDDVLVNRRLAQARLEKFKCKVTQACSGREAVTLVASATQPFDLVLMDVQMPEMDGLEATATIREKEANTDRHLPIVAMTAMAMVGDRERCLDAGMDAYLSKPIEATALEETLRHYCGTGGESDESPKPATLIQKTEVLFDEPAALARFGGDGRLLKELVQVYLLDAKEYLDQVSKAYSKNDIKALGKGTHKVKGAIAYFCSAALQAEAARLEAACSQDKPAGIDDLVLSFVSKVAAFNRALESYAGHLNE
ncbi:MAG TPA: response regulator [Candidatus Limnocylindria bacterium]|nr:response regulator [Candidatus Limnocylindria bacterium]